MSRRDLSLTIALSTSLLAHGTLGLLLVQAYAEREAFKLSQFDRPLWINLDGQSILPVGLWELPAAMPDSRTERPPAIDDAEEAPPTPLTARIPPQPPPPPPPPPPLPDFRPPMGDHVGGGEAIGRVHGDTPQQARKSDQDQPGLTREAQGGLEPSLASARSSPSPPAAPSPLTTPTPHPSDTDPTPPTPTRTPPGGADGFLRDATGRTLPDREDPAASPQNPAPPPPRLGAEQGSAVPDASRVRIIPPPMATPNRSPRHDPPDSPRDGSADGSHAEPANPADTSRDTPRAPTPSPAPSETPPQPPSPTPDDRPLADRDQPRQPTPSPHPPPSPAVEVLPGTGLPPPSPPSPPEQAPVPPPSRLPDPTPPPLPAAPDAAPPTPPVQGIDAPDAHPEAPPPDPARRQPPSPRDEVALPPPAAGSPAPSAADPSPALPDARTSRAAQTPSSPPNPATASSPPSPPSPASVAVPPGERGTRADREADPFSRTGSIAFSAGRVDARFGRQVRWVRPRLTLAGQIDAASSRNSAVGMAVTIDHTGRVTDVRVLESSGFPDTIDLPVVRAVYSWWFEPLKNAAGEPQPDILLIRVVIRN